MLKKASNAHRTDRLFYLIVMIPKFSSEITDNFFIVSRCKPERNLFHLLPSG